MTLVETIKQKIEKLPPSKQHDVLRYVEGLEQTKAPRPRRDPRGILAGEGTDISFEEFQQLRREAWGDGTDRELDEPA